MYARDGRTRGQRLCSKGAPVASSRQRLEGLAGWLALSHDAIFVPWIRLRHWSDGKPLAWRVCARSSNVTYRSLAPASLPKIALESLYYGCTIVPCVPHGTFSNCKCESSKV